MTRELEMLYNEVLATLQYECPVLSGNMQMNIKTYQVSKNQVRITINAPPYDYDLWKEKGIILHPMSWWAGGNQHYAWSVNEYGGFFTHNASEHWVDRAIEDSVDIIASCIGAEVK